jgi:hypothetical protein
MGRIDRQLRFSGVPDHLGTRVSDDRIAKAHNEMPAMAKGVPRHGEHGPLVERRDTVGLLAAVRHRNDSVNIPTRK